MQRISFHWLAFSNIELDMIESLLTALSFDKSAFSVSNDASVLCCVVSIDNHKSNIPYIIAF